MQNHVFPSSVPDHIPGVLVTDPAQKHMLQRHLAHLCGLQSTRFPGSQPISFDTKSLDLLLQEDFWVCEKSDGVRVLVLIVAPPNAPQEVFLIDRKDDFYQNFGLVFPHQDGPEFVHSNTVLDGELVIDTDQTTGMRTLRLLAFDCIVIDEENIMKKSLSSRYGRLKEWIIAPMNRLFASNPDLKQSLPFEVVLKKQELAYGIEDVFRVHLPSLQHGNDGLIFTSAEAPYTPGTDQKILKWKPPSENSIDFRLELRFPPLATNADQPDYEAKPFFALMENQGSGVEQFFDSMEVTDDEWEEWKLKGEQVDDRVVEVVWDEPRQTWRKLRFRDDKRDGNFTAVVHSILLSIRDGVEKEALIAQAPRIKQGWRAREQAKKEQAKRAHARPPPQNHGYSAQQPQHTSSGGGYVLNR